jgi:6-phosphogluconolactonase
MIFNLIRATLCMVILMQVKQPSVALSQTTSPAGNKPTRYWVYVGTYTHSPGTSEGIYLYSLDTQTGKIDDAGLAAKIADPSWLTIGAGGKFLYCCASASDGASIVASYSVDRASGSLTPINWQPSNGRGTCHVGVDDANTCAVSANYSSGDVSVLPIDTQGALEPARKVIKHTGSSINPDRQKQPYPHSCNFDPGGRFVYVPDLGVDKVYIYRYDAAAQQLADANPPFVKVTPGFGPRHMAFHPNRKFVYLINEMGGAMTGFRIDNSTGGLSEFQSIGTLPSGYTGENTSAEVEILPNGRFLYASNRGPDDIAIFSINQENGSLRPVGHVSTQGKGPRDFTIDPTGNFLFAANQYTANVVVYRIDNQTGALAPTGTILHVSSPVCVAFVAG